MPENDNEFNKHLLELSRADFDLIQGTIDRATSPTVDLMTLFNLPYEIPVPCRVCQNHPSNGGSGICHCTLGLPTIV